MKLAQSIRESERAREMPDGLLQRSIYSFDTFHVQHTHAQFQNNAFTSLRLSVSERQFHTQLNHIIFFLLYTRIQLFSNKKNKTIKRIEKLKLWENF